MEKTLCMIKPDGIEKGLIGEVIRRFENAGLHISALRMAHLKESQARRFYMIHKDKDFYEDLVKFICSGPVASFVVCGENAVQRVREIMGATDPKKAEKGTIRSDFASDIQHNIVHGSDSAENAKDEISFFFPEYELL